MKIHKSEMRNQKCEMRNSKGFSLIELVFAMSFLTIIILGVISLQTSNLAMLNSQNNVIQAHFYANHGLQIVEALGYNPAFAGCTPCQKKLQLTPGNYSLVDLGGSNEFIQDTIFERYIEIDITGLTNAYKATVLVEWEDSTGEHRRVVEGELINAHVEAKQIIY